MKTCWKYLGISMMVFSLIVTSAYSFSIETNPIDDINIDKPSGSAITYVSRSNNLTYQILVGGRMKGIAEVGQFIMINATFSEFIDEGWFQENFTQAQGILQNHSLTSQEIMGNKVSYILSCGTQIPDANKCYRILVRNGTSYASSPVSILYVKSAADPNVVSGLAVQNSGTGAISLTWTAAYDNVNVTHYRIYRRINSAIDAMNCESSIYATTNALSFLDTSISESNTYYYYVKAVDGINRINITVSGTVNLKPDKTAPSVISTVDFSGEIGTTITITITTQTDCASVALVVATADDLLEYDPVYLSKIETTATTTTWRYQIDTSNYFGVPMQKGSYTLKFVLTDNYGNHNSVPYEFDGGLVLNPPGINPFIIILIIAGAGAAIGIVLFIKMRGKRTNVPGPKYEEGEPRKREIYYGASKIGKMSGEAADAQMAARGRESVVNKPVLREKRVESVSPKAPSDSITTASGKQLPSAIQMKLEEQKVSADKKMQFLDSKVDSLISQLDILSSIISMKKDDILCPNCEHVMGTNWDVCPFCKIKDKDDELGLKKSAMSLDSKKKQCSKCGMTLDSSWVTCPKCYINSHQNTD